MIAALLGMLATGCASNAAPTVQPDPAGPLPTWEETGLPWQVPEEYLTERRVEVLCTSALVFIGTIVDARGFWGRDRIFDPPIRNGDIILSETTLAVERVIVGDPGPGFTDIFMGGRTPEARMDASGLPFPAKGRRFGLAFERWTYEIKLLANETGAQWGLRDWVALDPKAPLPSESRLQAERDRICQRNPQ